MKGLTFKAWREDHYVSLSELLLVLGRDILEFNWRLQLDELAPHPMAKVLEEVAPEKLFETLDLLRLVTPDVQIVDGAVRGYIGASDPSPVVVIRAVDSTSWDVESENSEIIAAIKRAYPDAAELPS